MLIEKLRSLPFFVLAFVGFIFIASAAGAAALTVNISTTAASLASESFITDLATVVENTNLGKASATIGATGQTQGTAVDADTDVANTVVNGALTAQNFTYEFEVKESGVNTWGSAREYRIEVFTDGLLTNTLFINNSTPDVNNVEGVTVRIDLGTGPTLPDNMTVKVQKISND